MVINSLAQETQIDIEIEELLCKIRSTMDTTSVPPAKQLIYVTFKKSIRPEDGWIIFSTHSVIERRIQALQNFQQ